MIGTPSAAPLGQTLAKIQQNMLTQLWQNVKNQKGRHDTQHKDFHHNDIQHNDIQHNDTQQNN